MYGGLFGDLPAAKSSKDKNGQQSLPSQESGRRDALLNLAEAPSSRDQEPTSTLSTSAGPVSEKAEILKLVGASGTSVAFVPTAALRRGGSKRNPSSDAARVVRNKAVEPQEEVGASETAQANHASAAHGKDRPIFTPLTVTETVVKASSLQMGGIETHEPVPAGMAADASDEDSYDEEERQRQSLHESVVDPYDPLVPNDLQQYLDLRALQEERVRMERQRREAIELQERLQLELRQQVQEQDALRMDSEMRIDGSHGSRAVSRGRGRGGISNLPAWMQQQQP